MPEEPFRLLEEDVKKLFRHKKQRHLDIWELAWAFIKGVLTFSILFIFFFAVINLPAYKIKFLYLWEQKFGSQPAKPSNNPQLTVLPITNNGQTNTQSNQDALNELIRNHVDNNRLVIPKIKVNVPIVWNSTLDKILDDLHNGVVHYDGTALPGENGNVFIAGHSSNYWWDKGKFNQIFALLDQVSIGDRIYINYNNQPFVYQAESIKIVNPNQIEVLNPTDHSVLTLMTCTPVGTTISRLIVQAKQIYPITNTGTTKQAPLIQQLPAIR